MIRIQTFFINSCTFYQCFQSRILRSLKHLQSFFDKDPVLILQIHHVTDRCASNIYNQINHINIKMENTHGPCGTGADHWADARAYDEALEAAGRIDLQLLGIRHNRNLSFKKHNDKFIYGTNIVKLTRSTIDANKIYFPTEDDMPKEAISFGIGGIMKAKAVILLALGKGKAQAIHDTVHGEIDPKCPASILKARPNTIIMGDQAAGSRL